MYRWGYWLTVGVLAGLISGYTILVLTVPYFDKEFRNPSETGDFFTRSFGGVNRISLTNFHGVSMMDYIMKLQVFGMLSINPTEMLPNLKNSTVLL